MKRALYIAACATVLATGAQAASVELEWNNPDEFRDVKATDMNQKRFEERVMAELGEQFAKEAAKLPEGQTLHVTVHNLDLAGEIEYFHANQPFGLRVIRRVDAPSMVLSHELRDADGTVISSRENELVRDMNFRFTTLLPVDRSMLRYDRKLVSDWFEDSFGPKADS